MNILVILRNLFPKVAKSPARAVATLQADPPQIVSDPVEPIVAYEHDDDIPLAALSLGPSGAPTSITPIPTLPVDTYEINEDFLFEGYLLSPQFKNHYAFMTTHTVLPSLSDHEGDLLSTSMALVTSSPFPYNSLLDSGCTHHIFWDLSGHMIQLWQHLLKLQIVVFSRP